MVTDFKTMRGRRDKINFLNGVLNGEKKINDLAAPDIIIYVTGGEKENVYKNKKTGRVLSPWEITAFHDSIRLMKDVKFKVTFKKTAGNEPKRKN
jgi:hypothetical protein